MSQDLVNDLKSKWPKLASPIKTSEIQSDVKNSILDTVSHVISSPEERKKMEQSTSFEILPFKCPKENCKFATSLSHNLQRHVNGELKFLL